MLIVLLYFTSRAIVHKFFNKRFFLTINNICLCTKMDNFFIAVLDLNKQEQMLASRQSNKFIVLLLGVESIFLVGFFLLHKNFHKKSTQKFFNENFIYFSQLRRLYEQKNWPCLARPSKFFDSLSLTS